MLGDGEVTNRCTVERTPFLDAYLTLTDEVFKANRLRDRLLTALLPTTPHHGEVTSRATQLFQAWEAGERAAKRMEEAQQHREQALSDHAARLLDQHGEAIGDVLEQAAHRLRDDSMFTRAKQLRTRARLRATLAIASQYSQGRVKP